VLAAWHRVGAPAVRGVPLELLVLLAKAQGAQRDLLALVRAGDQARVERLRRLGEVLGPGGQAEAALAGELDLRGQTLVYALGERGL